MKVQESITQKVQNNLEPQYFEVLNESHNHSVPQNSETHFKLVIVSDHFSNIKRIQRHRIINDLLADELRGPVHALSLKLYTREEWEARGHDVPASPKCLGGSKRENI